MQKKVADQTEVRAKAPTAKLKYRKTKEDFPEQTVPRAESASKPKAEKSWKFPAQEGAAMIKCLPYRKSCQSKMKTKKEN